LSVSVTARRLLNEQVKAIMIYPDEAKNAELDITAKFKVRSLR
jgi:hypothetical protein